MLALLAARKVRKSHALAKRSSSGEAVRFQQAAQRCCLHWEIYSSNVKTIGASVEHNAPREDNTD